METERETGAGPARGVEVRPWMWRPQGLGLARDSAELAVYSLMWSLRDPADWGCPKVSAMSLGVLLGTGHDETEAALRQLIDSGLLLLREGGGVEDRGPIRYYECAVAAGPVRRATERVADVPLREWLAWATWYTEGWLRRKGAEV